MERDAILVIKDLLSASDFYLEKHAWVYEALIECVRNRIPPDMVTVADELRRQDRLEKIGGAPFLAELVADVPSWVHAEYYAKIVARAAGQRRLIELGGEISAAAYDERRSLADLQQEIAARLQIEQRASTPRPDWEGCVIRGDKLYTKKFEPQPAIIEDILPQGTFLLTGKPKTKKSWLALNYALAVAWGGRALGHFQATQGDVLYVDLEMGQRRLHERLHVVSPDTVVPKNLHFASEWPKIYEGCERWLADWMEAHPFTRLIVFDTQTAIRPPRERNEEPYDHEKRYTQVLSDFCHQHGVAMLLIHHSRKIGGGDVIDDASGTTGLTAGVDNYGSLSRSVNEKDAGVLRLLGRDIRLDDDLNLKWDAKLATWAYMPDAADYSLTPERRAVLALLRDTPGLYSRQISELLRKDINSTRRLLHEMKKTGLVISEDGRFFGTGPYEADTA
jgi:hypothetical protein